MYFQNLLLACAAVNDLKKSTWSGRADRLKSIGNLLVTSLTHLRAATVTMATSNHIAFFCNYYEPHV